jgi:glycosyl transferase family 4
VTEEDLAGAGSDESEFRSSTVLLLSYHFYPSKEIGARRVTALAQYLARRAYRVVVVSAFDERLQIEDAELLPHITAISVPKPGRRLLGAAVLLRNRLRGRRRSADLAELPTNPASEAEQAIPGIRARLKNFFFRALYFPDGARAWTRRVAAAATVAGGKYHSKLIIASGPPHGVLLAGVHVARRLGIPFLADLRDPWSDAHALVHPESRFELKLHRILEGRVMRRASAVTTTTEMVAALLRQRYPQTASRIHVVRNGYDGEINPRQTRTGGRLSILFAGELYVGRNPFPFLSGIEWLLARPEVNESLVEVVFMGNVQTYAGQSLEAWLTGKRSARVVRLLPPQGPKELAAAIAHSTVLLNLAQRQPLSVPAKTYEQLASGREVLLICEDGCETARLVAGIRGVSRVDAENFQSLTRVLLDLYHRHAIDGLATVPEPQEVRHFSRTASNEQFLALVSELLEAAASESQIRSLDQP